MSTNKYRLILISHRGATVFFIAFYGWSMTRSTRTNVSLGRCCGGIYRSTGSFDRVSSSLFRYSRLENLGTLVRCQRVSRYSPTLETNSRQIWFTWESSPWWTSVGMVIASTRKHYTWVITSSSRGNPKHGLFVLRYVSHERKVHGQNILLENRARTCCGTLDRFSEQILLLVFLHQFYN